MAKIEWDDTLSIGIEAIDEEHKMLIQRLSELAEAVELNQGEMEIAKTLDFMFDYTKFHFESEEKYMARTDYPGLDEQLKLHAEFKKTLQDILDEYQEDGPTRNVTESINVFLMNWLVKHIKGVDHQFAVFLKEKNLT